MVKNFVIVFVFFKKMEHKISLSIKDNKQKVWYDLQVHNLTNLLLDISSYWNSLSHWYSVWSLWYKQADGILPWCSEIGYHLSKLFNLANISPSISTLSLNWLIFHLLLPWSYILCPICLSSYLYSSSGCMVDIKFDLMQWIFHNLTILIN